MRRLSCFPRVKWCIFENIIFRIAQKVSTRFSTVSQKGGALGESPKIFSDENTEANQNNSTKCI